MPPSYGSRAALSIALLVSFAAAAQTFPARIDKLELVGVERTWKSVIDGELGFKEGDTIDEAQWALANARLQNTELFSRYASSLSVVDGKTVARIEVEERVTVNPLFKFSTAGSSWWLRLGVSDTSLFGSFVEVGAEYERFISENGGLVYVRQPRFLGRRLELYVEGQRLVRPRPGYSLLRTGVHAELARLLNGDTLRLGLGATQAWDTFLAPLEGADQRPANCTITEGELSVRLGRVDLDRLLMQGATLELKPRFGMAAGGQQALYVQLFAEALLFQKLSDRLNLAVRLQAAWSSPAPDQVLFYLGGLQSVRDYVNNALHTRAYVLGTLELRRTLFDSTWFALQAATFVDAAVAQVAQGQQPVATSWGVGVRLLVPKFVKTGLRADLAVPLDGEFRPSPSFGVYQYF